MYILKLKMIFYFFSNRAHNYLEGNGFDGNSVPAIKLTLQKHVKLSANITW